MDFLNDEATRAAVVKLLQALIRIDTTNPPGNELPAARLLQDFYRDHGLEGEILTPPGEPARASFYLEIPGTDPKAPTLLLMSHLDVVTANPENWGQDPFGADIVPDESGKEFIHGRGAIDTKGLVAVQAVALAKLFSEGHEFTGTVKVLNEADEERAGTLGVQWLIKAHPDKLRCDLLLNEGGGQQLPNISGIAMKTDRPLLLVETACKGVFWLKVKIKGVSSHGSNPVYKNNPIMKARKILDNLYKLKMPIEVTPLFKEMVKKLPVAGWLKVLVTSKPILKLLLSNPDSLLSQLGVFLKTTISPNIITAGSKENVIPDEASIILDCRQLPGKGLDFLLGHLNKAVAELGDDVEIEPLLTFIGNESPFDHEYYCLLEKMMDERYGMDLMPFMLPGTEDAMYLRAAGLAKVGYGFLPMLDDTGDDIFEMAHGKNERISLDNVYLGTDFYYNFIKRFSCKVNE